MQEACNVSAGMAVLKVERGTVVQVSDEFTDLTGFSESEANGRSIGEITRMLKADSQIELGDIDGDGGHKLSGANVAEGESKTAGAVGFSVQCQQEFDRTELYPDIARLAERRGGEGHR